MFLIGLTGGIAAGKSTVAKLWSELGGIEIDADQVAREVVAKGTAGLSQVIEAFGTEYLDDSGELDRKAMAKLVFEDPAARTKLEGIIHPLVRASVQEKLATLPSDSMVFYTVPLLVEANVGLPFDVVVTVEAPEDVRIQRLVESRGMTQAEARQRIAAQAKPIERVANADHVLNSNQAIDLLLQDARNLWKQFQKRAAE